MRSGIRLRRRKRPPKSLEPGSALKGAGILRIVLNQRQWTVVLPWRHLRGLALPKNFHVLHVRGNMLVPMQHFHHPILEHRYIGLVEIGGLFALIIENNSHCLPLLEGMPVTNEALPKSHDAIINGKGSSVQAMGGIKSKQFLHDSGRELRPGFSSHPNLFGHSNP